MAGLFRAGQRPKASEPREPKARFGHATVVVDNNLLVWGGEDVYETSTVETFDVSSATWLEPRQLHGDTLPIGLYDMAVTSDKKRAYMFGGYSPSTRQRYNQLFVIDLTSLYSAGSWSQAPRLDLVRGRVVAWYVMGGS